MVSWKFVSVCSWSCKCSTIWFRFLVCVSTLLLVNETTRGLRGGSYIEWRGRVKERKNALVELWRPASRHKRIDFRSIPRWRETALESDINWNTNPLLDGCGRKEKHWKPVDLMWDACVCRQESLEVPEMYLGSLTQAVRHQLILDQIELERMLIGIVMVCSPTNKHKAASVSVYAHMTVPTNYSTSGRGTHEFGWLCCGRRFIPASTDTEPLGKKKTLEDMAPRAEGSRRQGRAILMGTQDITPLQTCIN